MKHAEYTYLVMNMYLACIVHNGYVYPCEHAGKLIGFLSFHGERIV